VREVKGPEEVQPELALALALAQPLVHWRAQELMAYEAVPEYAGL
jgi:hypothetical protein